MKITALMGLVALLAVLAFFGNTTADDNYVGSVKCGTCHEGNYETWNDTMHGIDFSNWDYHGVETNKYTMAGGNDTTGAFGSCASCHVVGWDDTDNGGTISTEPWNSTHNLPLGSIGCENCHGPGKGHVDDRSGNPDYMMMDEFAYSLSCSGWSTTSNAQEDRMGSCHDGGRMGGIEDEGVPGYYMSVHAGGIGPDSPKGNPECYKCMSAQGFISVTVEGGDPPAEDDFTDVDGEWFVDGELVVYGIYCAVCHDPHEHSDDTHFQLRVDEEELCEDCHYNTHVFPDTHVRHPTTEFRHGLNGKDVPVIEYMDEVNCPECHMYGNGHQTPVEEMIVGHSFEWVPQACVECHSMYTNETAEAYVETVHSMFDDLIAPFGNATTGLIGEAHEHMVWAQENGLWTDELNMTYLEAEWNFEYPNQDGSMGAHNPEFMKAMWESATEKYESVIEDTDMGKVMGKVEWDDGKAIEGAKIIDSMGGEVATTDSNGSYMFYHYSGTFTFFVKDSDGKAVGTINAVEVTTLGETDAGTTSFEKFTGGDGDDDDEDTDTMTYVFIGIIIVLIIILIVMAMMGNKGDE